MIQLGQLGRDIVTGFEGICMGKAQYLTGCNQALLTPRRLSNDGKRIDGEWFDEARIVIADANVLALNGAEPAQAPGCDERQAPTL